MSASASYPRVLAQLLQSEAAGIASSAARNLVDEHPELAARYRPQPELKWRPHLEATVRELAAAAFLESHAIFHRHLSWTAEAFARRGISPIDWQTALRVLVAELTRQTPAPDHPWINEAFGSYQPVECSVEPQNLRPEASEGKLAAKVLVRALEGERFEACSLLTDAVKNGMTVREAHELVIAPALREVGRMWHQGELTIPEEHACTSTLQTALAQILVFAPHSPRNGRCALAASVSGNAHGIGPQMVADAFELSGYRTVNLGSNVPTEDLVSAAVDFGADIVAISAALTVQLGQLADAVTVLHAIGPRAPRVIVGGAAFSIAPDLWKKVGADATAHSAWSGVEIADELLKA
ncbi:MAG: cobalamin B12-binding domain-containing protein [Phycisphaerales bacterium]